MAASGARKTTSSNKKMTKSTGSGKTGRGKSGSGQQAQSMQDGALFHEIGLIVLFAAMVLLFCCNFGIIGPAGDAVSGFLFGLFGLTAYAAPVLLFLAAAFGFANEGNPSAVRKLVAGVVLFFMVGIVCDLVAGVSEGAEEYSFKLIYESGRDGKAGGGIFAGSVSYFLQHYLGTIGAMLVVLVCSMVCLILLTEKSLINSVKRGGSRVREISMEEAERYREGARKWREDGERRREQARIRRAEQEEQGRIRRREQEEQRLRREEERRLKAEERENEKILRMERKFSGVMLDTALPRPEENARRDDIHEIILPEEEMEEYSAQGPGQEAVCDGGAQERDVRGEAAEHRAEAGPEVGGAFSQWDVDELPIRIHKDGVVDGFEKSDSVEADAGFAAEDGWMEPETVPEFVLPDEGSGAEAGYTAAGSSVGAGPTGAEAGYAAEGSSVGAGPTGAEAGYAAKGIGVGAGPTGAEAGYAAEGIGVGAGPTGAGSGYADMGNVSGYGQPEAGSVSGYGQENVESAPDSALWGGGNVPESVRSDVGVVSGYGQIEDRGIFGDASADGENAAGYGRSGDGSVAGYGRSDGGNTAGYGRSDGGNAAGYGRSGDGNAAGYGRSGDGSAAGYGRSDDGSVPGDMQPDTGSTADYVRSGMESVSECMPPDAAKAPEPSAFRGSNSGIPVEAAREPAGQGISGQSGAARPRPVAGAAASPAGQPAGAGMRMRDMSSAGAVSSGNAASSTGAVSVADAMETAARDAELSAEIAGNMSAARLAEKAPKKYLFPPIDLLQKGVSATGDSVRELKETALHLQKTLATFGVKVTITDISQGPSVTRYELQPEQGVKVSKIVGLADDIKLNLAAMDIRIEAPIPGKAAIGIEVPNKESIPVMLRELLETEEFRQFPSNIAFAVGKDIGGKVIVSDIAKMPHMLIAGATGSGKSVCINTLIMGILYKAHPDDVKLIMVDPKVVELSVYNGIPHLLIPVVTDPKKASAALHWGVAEMEDRYRKFAEHNVRDLKGYNKKVEALREKDPESPLKKLPQIVIIVDELADLMMVCPGEVEESICRLAQLARAAGIHLIIATQRPSVDVITGLIKANMPSRVAFSVSSGVDSRTILDVVGAEKLLGKGDMLFYPQGYPKPARVQGAFVSDGEVSDVVDFLKNQALGNTYAQDIEEKIKNIGSSAGGGASGGGVDDLFEKAGRLIIDKDKASIGMLQRALQIGFNRAARIMDQLCDYGVVGDEEGTKPRKILMSPEQFEQLLEEI